jgi:hypothetical protein
MMSSASPPRAGCRVLATRGDRLDAHRQVPVSSATGHVVGRVAAADLARYLNRGLAGTDHGRDGSS